MGAGWRPRSRFGVGTEGGWSMGGEDGRREGK